MSNFDIKREKLSTLFKYGGLAVLLVMMLPTLFTIFVTMAGVAVAAAVTAVTGILSVNFLPVLSMKAANWALKAKKKEARENPIETAQNQLLEMSKQLDAFKNETITYLAKGKALIDDVAEMRKEDPEGADSYNDDIKNFEIEAQLRAEKIQQAVSELEEARTKIDRANKRWNMQLKHSSLLEGSKEADAVLNKILIDEALSSVMENAHRTTSTMIVENIAAKARSDFKATKRNTVTPQPGLEHQPQEREGFVLPNLATFEKVKK